MCWAHRWQWSAAQLSPDYMDAWILREATLPTMIPVVLRPDFTLHRCVVCNAKMYPWRKLKNGEWCTPAQYRRRTTCSGWCGKIQRTGVAVARIA